MSTTMTKEELFRLIQETTLLSHENTLQLQEVRKSFQDTEQRFKDTEQRFKDTEQRFKDTEQRFKDTERFMKELSKETDRRFQETDRQIRELGKQIGGLGNKFGSFTEGMAFPSMEKLLRTKFKMEVIAQRVKSKILGDNQEIDILAYANTTINQVIIVEVKSHLKEREFQSAMNIINKFREAFPEHAGKKLNGIIATVDASPEMQEKVIDAGFYLAIIHDEHFRLKVPHGFQPKQF